MRKDSGFTLIEMITVIAVTAVISSIAIPNMISWQSNYRLSASAREIMSTLQLGRLKAIRENADVVIAFNPVSDSYTATVGGQTFRDREMPAGVDLDNTTFGGTIQFDGRGLPDVSGDVVLTNSIGSRTITVSLAGNSSIQ
jgi:prepilin-type N-terminal cleavage/methylation domain-containing protein